MPEVTVPSKMFLETYPLYRKFAMSLSVDWHQWPKPAILAPCGFCGSAQTFNMISDFAQFDEAKPGPGPGGQYPPYSGCIKVVYQCAGCGRSRRYFLLSVTQQHPRSGGGIAPPEQVTDASIAKVGQAPAWDVKPDSQLSAKLGASADILTKALLCESQGYGIGAFAYYRRILESIIDELLADIGELVAEAGHAQYSAALAEAKKSHRASEKIEHVKDLVPASLRPGGTNPLGILHGALSAGLHSMTEEECLESAAVIRGTLVFLVTQLSQMKQSVQQFTKDLQTLVKRQSARSAPPADTSPPGGSV